IKQASGRATLTSQLSPFGRRQGLQHSPVDLNAAVEHARDMLRRMIGEDIHLEIDLQPGLHCIQTDPGQLDQALVNLIANARDAMPDGGHLRIETAVLALDRPLANHFLDFAPGEYVRLRVADSGKGIDDDDLNRIFEPFYTTKDSGKGTGLGLSMVYSLVDQSNGQIDVTSRASEGTAFDLYFPLTDTRPAEAAVAQASPAVGEDINQSGEIILLVEDDDVVRNLARRVLGDHGYSVVEARHGEEALAMSELHKGPIHLLLTDVVMPKMSGRQLAQNLERLRPDIPVLYMSGYTDDTVLRYGVQENEVALLQKPFTPDALVAKVREVIGG
ncbi:ATP-binding protein, partial [bacterium]|nr:ATP-binding protein [bacterium]